MMHHLVKQKVSKANNDDWLKQNLIDLVKTDRLREDWLKDMDEDMDEKSRKTYKEDIQMSKDILGVIIAADGDEMIVLNTDQVSWLKMFLHKKSDIIMA